MPPPPTRVNPRARTIALRGTLIVMACAGLIVLQSLVLNPLAAVPRRTLPQIHAALDALGESLNAPLVVTVALLGVALAVGAFVASVRLPLMPRQAALVYLVLLLLASPAYFVASFTPGMALADAFGISGADHSPWAWPIHAVSLAALTGLVALVLTRGGRAPRADRADRASAPAG